MGVIYIIRKVVCSNFRLRNQIGKRPSPTNIRLFSPLCLWPRESSFARVRLRENEGGDGTGLAGLNRQTAETEPGTSSYQQLSRPGRGRPDARNTIDGC